MLLKSKLFIMCQMRQVSSKAKPQLIESFNSLLENEDAKHRKHPGIISRNVISLPEPVLNAMNIILEDVQNKSEIYRECVHFRNHLSGRHVPLEEDSMRELQETTREKILKNKNIENMTFEEINLLKKKAEPLVSRIVKQKVHNWQPVDYNKQKSLLYMIGRSVQNYSVLHSIFNEIRTRDENFKPETVLDFGSGIGTTMWAIKQLWPQKVKECVNVDISEEINNLSEKIIKILYPKFSGTFYRQFMPMSLRPNYDVTVSAYSLIELPNAKNRLDVVMKLWKKTKNYLVIVEQGNDAGFEIINEARDFILHLSNLNSKKDESEETHVFAPCPHDFSCPRKKVSVKPCTFEARYNSLPLLGSSYVHRERYSYVVLRKGAKSETDGNWPRIISPTLKRGGHAICRLCNSFGNLEEIIFTRSKHGRHLYRCARVSKWGHRIPVDFKIESDTDIDAESVSEKEDNSENDAENKNTIYDYEDETNK